MSNVNGSFLDKNGLTYLWSKLKVLFSTKTETDATTVYPFKNYLPNHMAEKTSGNCTWTKNDDDGTITVVTSAATTSEQSVTWSAIIPAGTYYFSCCTTAGSSSSGKPNSYITGGTSTTYDYGSLASRTLTLPTKQAITVRIRVPSGFSGTAVYKPMLRDIALSSELYDTYVPYRKRFESPYGSYIALTGSSSKHIDLNDYLTSDRVGIYYTVDGTYTGYLDNCPHSGSSIRLEVSKAGGYISQMIFTNNESNQIIYRRTAVEGDSTKIGAWKRFNNRDDEIDDIYGLGPNTTIGDTANLNSSAYEIPGVYRRAASSSTNVLNCPVKDAAFKLVVEYVNSDVRVRQTIYPLYTTSRYYVRIKTGGGWQQWYRFDSTIYAVRGCYDLNYATTIEANTNANSLTTPGVYVRNTYDNSTITNIPIKNKAFKLVVEYVNGDTRYRQTFYPLDSTCTYYVRMKTADGENGWGAWYQFSGTAVS